MKKIVFLILLADVCYGQTQLTSLTIQKDLRVQGEAIFGGVNKPVAGDMYIYYDSIYAPNIFGTGTFLTLNGAGYIELSTGGGGTGTVTNLSATDGNGFDFTVTNPTTTPNLTLTTTIGDDQVFYSDNGALKGVTGFKFDGSDVITSNGTNSMRLGQESIRWDMGANYTALYRTTGGSSYSLSLPNAQGAGMLSNDGAGNLTWASGGEVNTASNLGGGLANFDSKSGVDLRFNSFLATDFNLTSNLISLDYTNGQKATTSTIGFLTDTDWDTFNDKAPNTPQYIVSVADAGLTNEDVLTEGSAIDITNGSGTSTVDVDINELTLETSLDRADKTIIYDVSEGANNNTNLEELTAQQNKPNYRDARFSFYDEFLNIIPTGSNTFVATNSGTSAATNNVVTDANNRVGLIRSTTGTTATGRTSPSIASNAIRLGGGIWSYEVEVNVTTLSTITERYQLIIGFFDVQNAANQTDAVAFVYDEGGVSTGSAASANWQQLTSNNGARTWTTTGTSVSAATWVNLRIEVNAAASSVTYYINGVATGTTHVANIPSAAGRELGFGWLLIKSIGTTARTVDFDYIATECDFTTPR